MTGGEQNASASSSGARPPSPEEFAVWFRDRAYELMDGPRSQPPTSCSRRRRWRRRVRTSARWPTTSLTWWPTSLKAWREFITERASESCNILGVRSMGLDDREYMRERYRKRQRLNLGKTQWNDRAARVEMASGDGWFAPKTWGRLRRCFAARAIGGGKVASGSVALLMVWVGLRF